MRIPGVVVGVCALLLTTDAAGQTPMPALGGTQQTDPDPPVLSPEQGEELTAWLAAMDEWRRFDAKWSNRIARDQVGRVTTRPAVPEAPRWLPAYCTAAERASVLDLQAYTRLACRLQADPRAPASIPTTLQAARDDAEKPAPYSRFLTRIHLDGLWATTSTARSYGLIGSHMSLVDVGRVQVFGPPGVLVLSVPSENGGRRIQLGYTWGLSIRLSDVRLFGEKDMSLFLNVSKLWVSGGSYDIVGLSLARRARK